jgi:hypothetical protein
MAKAKWNLDFFQRADRKSGEISRWIGETRGPKIASSNMLLLWKGEAEHSPECGSTRVASLIGQQSIVESAGMGCYQAK